MGVGGHFWEALKPYVRFEGPDYLRGKRVAVDLSFWLVQHDAALRSRLPRARSPHLRITFFRTINLFAKMGAYPVFVVDGEPSPLKNRARAERFFRYSGIDPAEVVAEDVPNGEVKQRNGYFSKCVRECVELLELLGMPVVYARSEAEGLCAQLNREGYVDACITADSDAFLFGAKCVIKSLRSNSKEPYECYNLSDIEAGLGLKRKQMIGVALLVGNDFDLNGIAGFGADTAIRFVKLFGEEEVLERLRDIGKGLFPVENGVEPIVDFDMVVSSEGLTKVRSPHCSCCGHPGSKTVHAKSACEICLTSGLENCIEKPKGFRCDCLSCDQDHKSKEHKKKTKWQMRLCKKIGDGKDFPNNDIVQMYLTKNHGFYDDKDGPVLTWKNPKVDGICDFLSYHQHWEPSCIRQRLLPMLSTVFLREKVSNSSKGFLLCDQYDFHSISRVKIRYGHPYYLVKWKRTSPVTVVHTHEVTDGTSQVLALEEAESIEPTVSDDMLDELDAPSILLDDGCWFLLTDENMELVQAAFPQEVDKFLEEKRLKESLSKERKSRSGKKAKGSDSPSSTCSQLSITEFYRSRKVTVEVSRKDNAQNNSTDKNFPKSVRRRLLFD